MARPRKDQTIDEIEQEAGLGVIETQETKKPNEFEDEYTLEVISDYDPSADIFRIPKKDPNYSYRYLKDDAKNLSIKTGNLLYQGGGWQVCPRSHVLKIGFKESELSPDGSRRIGDHVLAFMPKHLFDKKEAAKVKKANVRMSEVNRVLKEGDPSVGADIHRTFKGIQTQDQLKMK